MFHLSNIISRIHEPFNFGCSVSGQKQVLDLQLLWQEVLFFLTQSVRVLEPLEKIPRFAKEYRSGNLYQYCSLCLLGFLVKPMFLHHTSCFVLFFCSPEVPIPKRTVKKMEERGAWQTPCEELFSERKPFEERESTMLKNSLENLDLRC